MEIPTPDETNDNIVAYWTPDAPVVKGQAMQFAYRMHWTSDEAALHGSDDAWVRQTFHTDGERLQANLIRRLDGSTAFLIDFEGPALAKLPLDANVTSAISVGDNAELLDSVLERNPAIRGWRLTLRVKVKNPAQAVEMRAALAQGDRPLTETWSYQLPPVPAVPVPKSAAEPLATPADKPAP
jgi:glucans biosynthesis protein